MIFDAGGKTLKDETALEDAIWCRSLNINNFFIKKVYCVSVQKQHQREIQFFSCVQVYSITSEFSEGESSNIL